jgi:predicted house-cleaning NTP pyrophosphatase (Maf/HAM1 superfamily)
VVVTGVVIKFGDKITKFTETAEVQFGTATPEQIQGYVDTGEPM